MKKFIYTLLCALFVVTTAKAEEHPLQQYVDGLTTFSANFEQVVPEDSFTNNVSKGHFNLKRPGNLFWQYKQPAGHTIIVERGNLWVFDDELEQVTVRPVADVQRDIPLNWLLFDEPIKDRFDIKDLGMKGDKHWYSLTPTFTTYFIAVDVALQDGKMVAVSLFESMDKTTFITFTEIEQNTKLPETAFKIVIPENMDVIGQPE